MPQGCTGEEGPSCKAEGTCRNPHAPGGCSKASAPIETIPRAVLWGVPAGPGTNRGREAVVPSSWVQVWQFKMLPKCIFFRCFSPVEILRSRKHRPWDTALGNLPRGCKFSKCSCSTVASTGGETGCPRAGTTTKSRDLLRYKLPNPQIC